MKWTLYILSILVGFAATHRPACADTVYPFYLVSTTTPGLVGTGSFSLNVAPSMNVGTVGTYVPNNSNPMEFGTPGDVLTAITFTIPGSFPGGKSYGYAPGLSYPSVTFTSCILTGISFNEQDGSPDRGSSNVQLSNLTYSYGYLSCSTCGTIPVYYTDSGTLSLVNPITVTAEPSSLALLSTGLAGAFCFARRRFAAPACAGS